MVIICAANGCFKAKNNTNLDDIQFHRFPLKKPDLLAKWLKAVKRIDFKPTTNSYLCSVHFKDSDYEAKTNRYGKILKATAVPSIFNMKFVGKKRKAVDEETVDGSLNQQENESLLGKDPLGISKDSKANLSALIGCENPGTLHLLIVGEDGEITNSEFHFKKEMDLDVHEQKPDVEMLDNEIAKINEVEIPNEIEDPRPHAPKSRVTADTQSSLEIEDQQRLPAEPYNVQQQLFKLKQKLVVSRKKVKHMQMKCRRLDKRVNELKVLLKLLVLKRGKGQKNIDQLFADYARNECNEDAE